MHQESISIFGVEEYALVANRKVGILLDPAMSRRWQASAAKRAAHDDRFLHLDFTIHGRQFAAHAVYLPLRNHPVDQHTAFEAAEAYYEKCAQHTARVGRIWAESSSVTMWANTACARRLHDMPRSSSTF